MKTRTVFIVAFLIAAFFQGNRFIKNSVYDTDFSMWASQARYVQTGNPAELDPLKAYGHPGGPIIEGTIAFHELGLSYTWALSLALTLINSIVIAWACSLCFIMKKDNLWWIAVLATLSLSPLYNFATPPSAAASVVIAFLCLLTLYMYENERKRSFAFLALWAFMSGFSIAIRADIGVVTTAIFTVILLPVFRTKKMLAALVGAFISFCIFDPFMWFMPVQHIKDLISKIVFQYADFAPYKLPTNMIVDISLLTFISVMLALIFILYRKKLRSPVPPYPLIALFGMTMILYEIFLTASYQAVRYFQPILFIWEMFLPIFLFSLVDQATFDSLKFSGSCAAAKKITKYVILCLLLLYPVIVLLLVGTWI